MPHTSDRPPTLWERTRQQARAEIIEVAMDLFLEKGFAATTIDEISAAAGISRRSFFRYFGTKEDIVVERFVADADAIGDALDQRPDDEDPWAVLRGALATALETEADEERLLAISRMVYETPSLRARSYEKHLRWYDSLVPQVERRLGGGPHAALRAKAIVGCVITCLDIAGEAWTHDGGKESLIDYFDTALEAMRSGGASSA